MTTFKKNVIFGLIIYISTLPLYASAQMAIEYEVPVAGYNSNRIINDEDFFAFQSMTIQQIQDFVIMQGGSLGSYIDPAVQMPAYYIIWQTAQEFQISPKFILTMLQKEQSLLTDPNPTTDQYDWAVGYSCYGGVCLDKYRGFSTQIRAMANKFASNYMADLSINGRHVDDQNCTFTKWCVGQAKATQDGFTIIPENHITAALYTYNPYRGNAIVNGAKIGANYNFYKIWSRWFGINTNITIITPPKPAYRPNGTLVKSKNSDVVYLIENGNKRPFANLTALISRYDPKLIIIIPKAELDKYPTGKAINFAQYSILMDEKKQKYLLIGETLKPFANNEVFKTLGFNPEEIIKVKLTDIQDLATGTPITLKDAYPLGAVLQDNKGNLFYVQAGVKHAIIDKVIKQIAFPKLKIKKSSSAILNKYASGDPLLLPDQTLIKTASSSDVYIIGAGFKHKILNELAFISRGYDWHSIFTVSQAVMDLHKNGQDLDAIVNINFGPEDEFISGSTTK